MQLNNSVLNICCITTNMECTIIQLCTYNYIYQHVGIYTAQTNTFSQVKYYYNVFFSPINVFFITRFLLNVHKRMFWYLYSSFSRITKQTILCCLLQLIHHQNKHHVTAKIHPLPAPTTPTMMISSPAPPVSALQASLPPSLPPPVNSQIHKQTNRGVWK